jgi:AcrR family transcriptional regulator
MLAAAYALFCANGYAATTMAAIAREAGVAVQTLYFTFHTKGAILSEAVGACILGFDRWTPSAEAAMLVDERKALADLQPWLRALAHEKSQARALAVFVDAAIEILARVAPLARVMAAAAADPEVKAMSALGERRRVQAYRVVIDVLAKKGRLRRGLAALRANDILLTILSSETYLQLTAARGWSRDDCRRWFSDVLVQQLLPSRA